MTRFSKAFAAALAAATLLAGAAGASADERYNQKPGVAGPQSAKPAPERVLGIQKAQAANVPSSIRVALVFDALAPADENVTRSKGVTLVRNPAAGKYCIRTAYAGATVLNMIPQVTPERYGSSGSVLLTYYRESTGGTVGCYANEIGVETLRLVNGTFTYSDFVGFSLIAP